jgi:hypothetical protein
VAFGSARFGRRVHTTTGASAARGGAGRP